MKKQRTTYIKNILLPCLVFSFVTGITTGCVIFLFKIASKYVFDLSANTYQYVQENPVWLPVLLLGAALIGLLAAWILKRTKNCRGGGIPSSVAILRGLIEFRWLKSIFYLFVSSLLTFLGGIPLGNEGPSVQMGTAIGKGTVRIFAKKQKAWDRYVMTGGACGGFACATGAPLTGILFAFEEAHRKFSPMLFMTAAMTVTVATAIMRVLCEIGGISPYMFDLKINLVLPLSYLWLAVFVGILCGLVAVLFTKLYAAIGKLLTQRLQKLSFTLKIVVTFLLVALCGFACKGAIGSGHDIIHELIYGHGVWYLLILYFCIRAIFLMLANHSGISGGLFVPTLTFGAIIGGLCAKLAIATGLLPEKYYILLILIGMAAFLSASSRTPLTAIAFALEALGGLSNVLPIAIGVTFAFLTIETWGITALHDIVIEQKVAKFNEGKQSTVVDTFVRIMPDSFAVGKEVYDILLPPTCTVLSIKRAHSFKHTDSLNVGDILHLHYQTYEPETTLTAIEAIVGCQTENQNTQIHTVNPHNHIVPLT